jgi:hypothetical protein
VLYIGGDGCFKIGAFGTCIAPASDLLPQDECVKFERDLERYTKPGVRPPELKDVSMGAVLTTKIDTWQLGLILDSLLALAGPERELKSKYSAELLKLRQLLLKPNPRERITTADVVQFIINKESLAVSGRLVNDADGEPESPTGPAQQAGPQGTRSFFSGVKERWLKYINKTGTKYPVHHNFLEDG